MPAVEGRVYGFGELNRDTFKGLPGMLADSLPDTYGRALFENFGVHIISSRISIKTPFGWLEGHLS